MSRFRTFVVIALGLVLLWRATPGASAQAELDAVLRQMEATGRAFKSFSANFAQKKYTAILKEFDQPETGIFVYARARDGSALLRQEVQKPGVRILTINGGVAKLYQPKMKQATIMNLGKNKDKAEYLALGLGQSPAKLRETFDIKYVGTETIAGVPTSVLSLKPKSGAAAAYFSSITLWVKKANGVPIQQKLTEPNGDYLLVNFSGEKLNIKTSPAMFEQKFGPGTEVQTVR